MIAGALLATAEILHGLASGFYHPLGYFALCAALAIGSSAALELACRRIRALRPHRAAIWSAAAGSLADLLARLEATGFLGRAWVFITSDHGESFGEHGVVEHGTSLYSEQTQIPLVVLPPVGRTLATHAEAVGLLDVTATLAEIAGVAPLGVGRSLLLPGGSSTI